MTQTPPPDQPGSNERDLIAAAFDQFDATPDPQTFPGETLPPPGTFPGYDLIKEIHRGGQGTVFMAVQRATKRRVALKVMHGGALLGSAGKARFEREVQVLGQLNHPNIVKIHDSGITASGDCYYIMDYISGRSLDEIIRGDEQPIDETLRLFLKICDGVNAAHLKGVIHRDLKPSNIRIDLSGEPIIVDFGLAKIAAPDVVDEGSTAGPMTITGQFVGSLPWASPEQARGSPEGIDIRSDVYSLGVILYQLLTRRFPYNVLGNMRDVLDNILRAEPQRPSTVRRRINDEVETIVLRCLQKEQNRRYQSAGDLARDVERYLNGEPIEAKRDSAIYILRKTLVRHRVAAAVAGVGLLLIFGWGVTAAGLLSRERAARREADAQRDAAIASDARARENFDIVRHLSRAVLYDLDAQIAHLRGGTRIREEILAQTQRYIERLRPQADDDPDCARELADAHDLYAAILGGLEYRPSLGRTDEAARHIAEARSIREALMARFPDDPRAHAELARSQSFAAALDHIAARFEDAISGYASALASIDRAIALERDEARKVRWLDDRARAQRRIGETCQAAEQHRSTPEARLEMLDRADAAFAVARAHWQQRADANPRDDMAVRALGEMLDLSASARLRRASVLLSQASSVDDSDASELVVGAAAIVREARETLRLSAEHFTGLVDRFPASRAYRRNLHISRFFSGQAALQAEAIISAGKGRLPPEPELLSEALAAYTFALGIAEDLAADTADVQAQRDVALTCIKVGQCLGELGRFDEALPHFQRSVQVRELLASEDPTTRARRDAARGHGMLGEFYEKWASAEPTRRDELLLEADRAIRRYQSRITALVNEGLMPHDAVDVREGAAALERIRRKREGSP
ncbi:MAG: serine/threonine protein kinase [Phycisphaeraceae bacterium]|nr:serine/threonine protein kinase [Phycisphaeraceae bacterium]MCW5754836.1 serine/threonine protein kinase [Phycisphaeraceae bacterium]